MDDYTKNHYDAIERELQGKLAVTVVDIRSKLGDVFFSEYEDNYEGLRKFVLDQFSLLRAILVEQSKIRSRRS